ncbi:MAG: hypothetical protein CMO81_10410 [Waddliaceae bacterium]|nr:hypothetical protein [Waddliaceae bacterium]
MSSNIDTAKHKELTESYNRNEIQNFKSIISKNFVDENLLQLYFNLSVTDCKINFCQFLSEKNVSIEQIILHPSSQRHITPLNHAVLNRTVDLAKILIGNQSHIGPSLLIDATFNSCTDMVKLLVDNNAMINISQNKYSPLSGAISGQSFDQINYLLEHGAEPKFLGRDSLLELENLVRQGEDIRNCNQPIDNKLQRAVDLDSTNLVQELLENSISMEINYFDLIKNTILRQNSEMLFLLLNHCSLADVATEDGALLKYALESRNSSLVDLLVQYGATLPKSVDERKQVINKAYEDNISLCLILLQYNLVDINEFSSDQTIFLETFTSKNRLKSAMNN